jgi:electron transfer flavoprotein beta subunit
MSMPILHQPMKILVCIKQVPDPETPVRVDERGRVVQLEENLKYWMNRADAFAVEEAILIKEAGLGTTVDALTVGPERAAQVLERAMGMGADNGVHILLRKDVLLSPLNTASYIAAYALNKSYDLILTGVMGEDHMQGQVGAMLAELLGFPCATSVILEEIPDEGGSVYVEREIEGGLRSALELDLPAVLTVQTGINKPRYPTFSNLLRAKKQKALFIESHILGAAKAREKVVRACYPGKSRAGLMLEGCGKDKAVRLLEILEKEALLFCEQQGE